MVKALCHARIGLGGSSPNSKRIIKSVHCVGSARMAATRGAISSSFNPYLRKTWATSS